MTISYRHTNTVTESLETPLYNRYTIHLHHIKLTTMDIAIIHNLTDHNDGCKSLLQDFFAHFHQKVITNDIHEAK